MLELIRNDFFQRFGMNFERCHRIWEIYLVFRLQQYKVKGERDPGEYRASAGDTSIRRLFYYEFF